MVKNLVNQTSGFDDWLASVLEESKKPIIWQKMLKCGKVQHVDPIMDRSLLL